MAPLRFMRHSPDDNVSTTYFSPLMARVKEGNAPELQEEMLARALELTGFYVFLEGRGNSLIAGNLERLDGRPVRGFHNLNLRLKSLAEGKEGQLEIRPWGPFSWFQKNRGPILLRPRVALLPWIGPNAFVSWLVGVPFSPFRQLLGIRNLSLLHRYWAAIPRQFYNLDDAAAGIPGFIYYRLSSLFLSFFLALLAWNLIWHGTKRGAEPPFGIRCIFLAGITLMLQFVIVTNSGSVIIRRRAGSAG